MKKYRFYKLWDSLEENRNYNWFIDLPNFPFDKTWLAMVAGADTLLDKLSEGKDEVTLLVSTKPFPYTDGHLVKKFSKLTGGGIYDVKHISIGETEVGEDALWLCPATLWVFLRYPEKIYFKVDKTKLENRQKKKLFNFPWLYGKQGELSNLSIA